MDQYFKELSSSKELDSTWVSKLIVDIPTPGKFILGQIIDPSIVIKEHHFQAAMSSTDIIPLLLVPSNVTLLQMEQHYKYPKGCSFFFEGYNGVEDFERLKNMLISCASKSDGTQLTVVIHDEFINKASS